MPTTSSASPPASQKPELLFVEETHEYFLDGVELPSVTTVLKDVGIIDDAWYTEFGRQRGTYVHQALEWLDRHELDEDSVDPVLAPYVAAYVDFCAGFQVRWSQVELRLADPLLGFAGTVDRVGFLGEQRVVLDVKTGAPEPWHPLQLAAYHHLVATKVLGEVGPHQIQRVGLYLTADGKYRVERYADRHDFPIFRAALSVVAYRRAHGLDDRRRTR